MRWYTVYLKKELLVAVNVKAESEERACELAQEDQDFEVVEEYASEVDSITYNDSLSEGEQEDE